MIYLPEANITIIITVRILYTVCTRDIRDVRILIVVPFPVRFNTSNLPPLPRPKRGSFSILYYRYRVQNTPRDGRISTRKSRLTVYIIMVRSWILFTYERRQSLARIFIVIFIIVLHAIAVILVQVPRRNTCIYYGR